MLLMYYEVSWLTLPHASYHDDQPILWYTAVEPDNYELKPLELCTKTKLPSFKTLLLQQQTFLLCSMFFFSLQKGRNKDNDDDNWCSYMSLSIVHVRSYHTGIVCKLSKACLFFVLVETWYDLRFLSIVLILNLPACLLLSEFA